MAFTFNVSTDRGKVRLMIPDRKEEGRLYEDEEIDAFLALEGGNLKRGAALALETAASDQALVLKVIKLLDLSTDGAKVSDALLKRAAELRKQATAEEESGGVEEDAGFDWAEMTVNQFASRERMYKEGLRHG